LPRALDGPRWRPTPAEIHANAHLVDIAAAPAVLGTDAAEAMLAAWDRAAALVGRHWRFTTLAAGVLQLTGRLSGAQLMILWRARRAFAMKASPVLCLSRSVCSPPMQVARINLGHARVPPDALGDGVSHRPVSACRRDP
jgi:hypothetical protein